MASTDEGMLVHEVTVTCLVRPERSRRRDSAFPWRDQTSPGNGGRLRQRIDA